MTNHLFEPYSSYRQYSIEEMQKRSKEFLKGIVRRRTVRDFSDKPVPRDIIENCIKAAGSSPSGANHQPWHFVVVTDPDTKTDIRKAAEEEEKEYQESRAQKCLCIY